MQKPVTFYDAEFNFPSIDLNTKDLLDVKDLVIGYDFPLLPPLNIHMRSGTKLWVRGTNGIGKSTLINSVTILFNYTHILYYSRNVLNAVFSAIL